MRFFTAILAAGAASAVSIKSQADTQLNAFMELSTDQRETILT